MALVLGIGGIVLLMEPWSLTAEGSAPVGYAMLLAAAFATAVATVHMRSHHWTATPLALMPWQLGLAGGLSVVMAVAVHGSPLFPLGPRELAVIAYEVVLASGFGVWGTITLSRGLPAVSTGILMMAVPVIGVASSAALLDERVSVPTLGGMALVLVGVGLVVHADRRTRPPSEPV
jgi:drug/metabolite transporter (DMT)-like permease